jgi:hypothetical protein
MHEITYVGTTSWKVVRSTAGLDPSRYLGVRLAIPPDERPPGDWFDLVIAGTQPEVRWTMVAVDGRPAAPRRRESLLRRLAERGGRRVGDGTRGSDAQDWSRSRLRYEPAPGKVAAASPRRRLEAEGCRPVGTDGHPAGDPRLHPVG